MVAAAHANEQDEAQESVDSARKLTIAAQIALGVIWGINALDAGIIEPPGEGSALTFEAQPIVDGIQFLVRAPL